MKIEYKSLLRKTEKTGRTDYVFELAVDGRPGKVGFTVRDGLVDRMDVHFRTKPHRGKTSKRRFMDMHFQFFPLQEYGMKQSTCDLMKQAIDAVFAGCFVNGIGITGMHENLVDRSEGKYGVYDENDALLVAPVKKTYAQKHPEEK